MTYLTDRKQITSRLLISSLALLSLLIFCGCPGTGTPTITLTVTDCAKADITITDNTRITPQPGNQWSLSTVVTVMCNGQPVKDAEIKFEFWWPGGTFSRKTNSSGKIHYTKKGHGTTPTNKTFTVTIKGNDGEKSQDFSIP